MVLKFTGIYTLKGPAYGPLKPRFDELTELLKSKAKHQNLPMEVEEELRPAGHGEVIFFRHFVTGQDLLKRRIDADQRKAIAQAIDSTRQEVTASVHETLEKKLSEVLADFIKKGTLTQKDIELMKSRLTIALSVEGFNENPPKLSKVSKIIHDVWGHFAVRLPKRGKAKRANLIKAVHDGHFNIETGKLRPDVFVPCDTGETKNWANEN